MFQGRYGNDFLNKALFVLALIVMLVKLFIHPMSYARNICTIIYMAFIALALWRMFSRDCATRAMENEKFTRFFAKLTNLFKGGSRTRVVKTPPTFEDRRKYKYFYCNLCSQRLRVPRGKGTLRVTCTRCGNRFQMKS